MTPTASPPEAAPRRRVLRRRPRSRAWEWAAQAVLIVFGVVVGLALNEWRQDLADAERTDRVLAALADEVASNRAAVEPALAYYGEMYLGAQAILEARGPNAAFDMAEAEGYVGDPVPTLTAGTYNAATATGALLDVDIGLLAAVSSAYSSQASFEEALATNLLSRMSEASPQVAVWRAGTVYSYTQGRIEYYDRVLERLGARAE